MRLPGFGGGSEFESAASEPSQRGSFEGSPGTAAVSCGTAGAGVQLTPCPGGGGKPVPKGCNPRAQTCAFTRALQGRELARPRGHRCPGGGAAAPAGGRGGRAGARGPGARGEVPARWFWAPPRRSGFLFPPAGCWLRRRLLLPPSPLLGPLCALGPPRPRPGLLPLALSLPLEPPRSPQPRGTREDGGGGRRRRRRRGGRRPGRRGGAPAGVWAARARPVRRGARRRPGPRARPAAAGGGRGAAAADAPGAEQPQENPGEKPAPGQQLPGTGRGCEAQRPGATGQELRREAAPEVSRLVPGAWERSWGGGGRTELGEWSVGFAEPLGFCARRHPARVAP